VRRSITLIIPNFNGIALLQRYLGRAVESARCVGAEVVLADDGSSDGSPAWAERAFPSVTVIRSPRNVGFGGVCNLAASRCSSDVLAFLNNDVAVPPHWLDALLPAFEDAAVFSITPGIRIPARPDANDGFTYFSFNQGLLTSVGPCFLSSAGAPSTVCPVGYGVGAAVLVDARKFRAIGGFDPCLSPYYYEDADLGFSAWERGWSCLCDPRVEVSHKHQGTIRRTERPEVLRRALFRNRLLFTWKHINSRRLVVLHLGWLARYALSHVRHRRWPEGRGLIAALKLGPRAVKRRTPTPRLADLEVIGLSRATEFAEPNVRRR
jgi:GT2 family glycosyltransferase